MGKASRTKGRAYEQEIARAIRDELGLDAERVLRQWQSGGGGDVTAGPFLIECKRPAGFVAHQWMAQVVDRPTMAGMPVVCARGDRHDTLVLLNWADFVRLARAYLDTGDRAR